MYIALILIPIAFALLRHFTKKYIFSALTTLSCAAIALPYTPIMSAALFVSFIGDYFMAHKGKSEIKYLLGIAGFFLIEDHVVTREENKNFFGNIFYGFRPGVIRKNMSLYGTLILLALFNISIQIFMPYLILYYTESLGFENYVLIFAPAIALSALFTGLYGKVYDRKGFTMAIIPTLALLTVGYVGLIFVRSMIPVFLFSLLMMCGFLGTGAMLGARVRDCTPEGKAGMFQGLRIIGQVLIPGVIGPAIGAWLLRNAETIVNTDGTTSFIPNESIFIGALVAAGVVWLALSPLFFKKKEV